VRQHGHIADIAERNAQPLDHIFGQPGQYDVESPVITKVCNQDRSNSLSFEKIPNGRSLLTISLFAKARVAFDEFQLRS